VKNTKMPPMVLLITQNTHIKIPSKSKLFFLSFLMLKALFYYTLKLKKPEISLSSSPSFLDLGGKEVFFLVF